MKKVLLILSFALISVAFTSCETSEDDDTTFDRLVGRTWIGDFGMFSPVNGLPVESGITFQPNGFGQDELYYYKENGGQQAGKLAIRWELYRNTLRVDYGNEAPSRELRNVRIWHGELSGDLYIFDNASEGPYYGQITLFME